MSSGIEQKRFGSAGNALNDSRRVWGHRDRTKFHALRYSLRNFINIELLDASFGDFWGTRWIEPKVVVERDGDFVRGLGRLGARGKQARQDGCHEFVRETQINRNREG